MTDQLVLITQGQELLRQAEEFNDEGDLESALLKVEELNAYSRQHSLNELLASSLKLQAIIFQSRSNYAGAMKAALEARELFSVSKNLEGESDCLNILGGVYNYLGDLNNRLQCNLDSLELRRKLNKQGAVLSSLNNIGDTYLSLRDFKNALRYFEQCLTFGDVTDNILAIVKCNMAEVYFLSNQMNQAAKYNEEGLEHAVKSDYHQIIIAAHTLNGQIKLHEKLFNEALNCFEKARKVFQVKESKEQEIEIYRFISDCYLGLGNHELAYDYLNKHLLLFHEVSDQNNSQKMKKIEFDFQFKTITRESKEIKEKNELLTKAFGQIEEQSKEIQLKNKSITDSIHYAKRIQYAILPSDEKVKEALPNSFVFYHPKDIVSGDFYWVDKLGDTSVFAVVDCTGHGVPGAFVSIIANNALNKIILEDKITTPSEVLNAMNTYITEFFQKSDEQLQDGVDMGICSWHAESRELQFAGAFNSLFMMNDGELLEVKGNRESIGASIYHHEKEFKNYSLTLEGTTNVYLSSDGFPDQFGGERGKKLKWKGFRELLSAIGSEPIETQQELVKRFLHNWIGELEQLDDICMMGIQL